jgi:hypothetical protein
MTFVIKNLTTAPLTLDGVTIDPGEQLDEAVLSSEMIAARNAGTLQVREIWFVPVVSRVSGETTVVEMPAGTVANAIMDYHRGIDRGWAGRVPILLNARTTREPDPGPGWAELEKAFKLAISKPSMEL